MPKKEILDLEKTRRELYALLAEAEEEAATGFDGHPLDEVMRELLEDE